MGFGLQEGSGLDEEDEGSEKEENRPKAEKTQREGFE